MHNAKGHGSRAHARCPANAALALLFSNCLIITHQRSPSLVATVLKYNLKPVCAV